MIVERCDSCGQDYNKQVVAEYVRTQGYERIDIEMEDDSKSVEVSV